MPGSVETLKSAIRRHLPAGFYRSGRRAWHWLTHRPGDPRGNYQEVLAGLCPLAGMQGPAVINITVDFELAWNITPRIVDNRRILRKSHKQVLQEARAARECLEPFAELCEQYSVPVTFACVGHLFLTACRAGSDGKAHSEMPRFCPDWWPGGDWLSQDPAGDAATYPFWYAPDLIRRILNSPVKHEIGCHTFSHVDLSDPACTAEIAEAEINAFFRAAKDFGVDRCVTFIFPRNRPGHCNLLARHGFIIYRDMKLSHAGCIKQNGLLGIPGGLHLTPMILSPADVIAAARVAVERGAFLHMNMHLCEFSGGPRQLRAFFNPLFGELAKLRSSKRAELLTLEQVVVRSQNFAHT